MSRRVRRWTGRHRRWIFASVVSAGMLLVLEVCARFVPVRDLPLVPSAGAVGGDPAVMVPDTRRIWRLMEGAYEASDAMVRVDADGFRLPASPGPPGAPLILTVGDSSVFGHGVPDGETLHDQLQTELHRSGVAARVGTVAVPGYSTFQSLAALEDAGWARDPALLVIANLWSDTTFSDAPDLDRMQAAAAPSARVLGASALFRLTTLVVRDAAGMPTATKVVWPNEGPAVGVQRVAIADYLANLVRLVEEARAHDTGVVFLTLTNTHQFVKGEKSDTDWAPYRETQRAVAKAAGAVVVDGQAVFTASGKGQYDLFIDAVHPSGTGQGLLAVAVAHALVEAGWPAERLIPASPGDVPPVVMSGEGERRP